MNAPNMTRRAMLRGGAVALGLPWLETLAAKAAKAAGTGSTQPVRRYVNMYFPNGTTDRFWLPAAPGPLGTTAASAILEPLAPLNQYLLILNGVGNYSAFGGVHPEPSHGANCAAAFHGYDGRGRTYAADGKTFLPSSGISVDQVIAGQIGSLTRLPSLQVGLSTLDSYCDGCACEQSRSMSWAGTGKPLYKTVNPQAVFDTLVTAGAPPAGQSLTPPNSNMPNPALAQTKALKKSVLDSVIDSATTLRTKLSTSDQARIDQYLTSVRDLEQLVAAPAMQITGATGSCTGQPRPPEAYADMNTPPDYSRETHANLMIQLVTMAFACDLTRTVTFMMDDARSDYVYSHVTMRNFNKPAAGMLSSPGTGTVAGYHGLQHAGPPVSVDGIGNINDGFATIGWWMASKASMLGQALANIKEGAGNVLMDTVIHLGSGMHGSNHDPLNIPLVLIGSGGGVLKQGQYLQLTGNAPAGNTMNPGATAGVRLADVHLTLIQKVFGATSVTSFGSPGGMPLSSGTPVPASTGIIPAILA
jgi:hypothetical protein